MVTNRFARVTPLLLGLALGMSACGGQAYHTFTTPIAATTTVPTTTTTTTTTGSTTSGFPFSTTGTSSTTSSVPPITTSFSVSGAGGVDPTYTFNVNTDNLLKVDIAATPAGNLSLPGSQYSNFTANYQCVNYKVTVLGQTVVTQTLSVSTTGGVNYDCPSAPNDQVLDFSSRLTTGHQSVDITVQADGYDFYCSGCQSYSAYGIYNPYGTGSNCSLYCSSLYSVYKTHTVTGNLTVYVNGTTTP